MSARIHLVAIQIFQKLLIVIRNVVAALVVSWLDPRHALCFKFMSCSCVTHRSVDDAIILALIQTLHVAMRTRSSSTI